MTRVNALVMLGDWNCSASTEGRWSTSWLASHAGLRIHDSGPGRHGDIDYGMSDAHASAIVRHQPPAGPSRSDHDVVLFTLHDPDNEAPPLQLATWNVERDRSPKVVLEQVAHVLNLYGPDVLALQEAKQYHPQLRQLGEQLGYKVLASSVPGQWHNVIMARSAIRVAGPLFVQLSPHGWHAVAGGDHTPLFATSWRVGWLRVVCVHMPPSVRWVRGLPVGPVMRVAAMVIAVRRLRRWAVRNRRRRA